jgi:glucan phosphoethanolaminetransferase (alkaline phosphatase superfamily)
LREELADVAATLFGYPRHTTPSTNNMKKNSPVVLL